MTAMKKYILFVILIGNLCGCHIDETSIYGSGRYVHFATVQGMDSVHVSFANYPDQKELTLYFKVNLIGDLLLEPTSYVLAVVDSLTTAPQENYDFPENPLFKPQQISDTLAVKIIYTESLKDKQETLVLEIKEGVFISHGLRNQHRIKILFDAIPCQPIWWDQEVEKVYLGKYSNTKFREFILCTRVSDLTGMNPSLKRAYALQFKKYIEENNIMDQDENGKEFPMSVPVY